MSCVLGIIANLHIGVLCEFLSCSIINKRLGLFEEKEYISGLSREVQIGKLLISLTLTRL